MSLRRVRVVAAYFRRGDRVLVQQRPPGKSRGLLWEFPGGKVEAGESDEAALARECAEELGVPVEVGERLWSTVHRYPDLHVELLLYRASMPTDATPQPHDAHQLAWVELRELPSLPFCEADVPLLPLLASGRIG